MSNDTDQPDLEPGEEPNTGHEDVAAVAVREPSRPETVTPAQARTDSVAKALDLAYANASKLELSKDEAARLADPFPDEAFRLGAGGDPNLIYIEHAYLRQRLNSVLGVGAAVPIRRREWAEDFTYWKDGAQKKGVRVYVDLLLLVRGCLVGEAIGDAVYYPDNAKTNYSDALESAKSSAMRRCCKEFGVGLQAWMKGWGDEWKKRQMHPQPHATPTATAPAAGGQKPQPVSGITTEGCSFVEIKEKSGVSNGKPWTVFFCKLDDGTEMGTFDKKLAEAITKGIANDSKFTIVSRPGRKQGSIELVSAFIEETNGARMEGQQ